jgi:hypothetical protein
MALPVAESDAVNSRSTDLEKLGIALLFDLIPRLNEPYLIRLVPVAVLGEWGPKIILAAICSPLVWNAHHDNNS